jgi:hypothetical protein
MARQVDLPADGRSAESETNAEDFAACGELKASIENAFLVHEDGVIDESETDGRVFQTSELFAPTVDGPASRKETQTTVESHGNDYLITGEDGLLMVLREHPLHRRSDSHVEAVLVLPHEKDSTLFICSTEGVVKRLELPYGDFDQVDPREQEAEDWKAIEAAARDGNDLPDPQTVRDLVALIDWCEGTRPQLPEHLLETISDPRAGS